MDDRHLLEARLADLASRAWRNDILTNTGFLTLAEQAVLEDLIRGRFTDRRLDPAPVVLWGGYEEAERKAAFFLPSYLTRELFLESGDRDSRISCLRCRPLQAKFADDLTHRDFLGALMNLGIERETVGDILVDQDKNEAYLFVTGKMAAMVCDELTRVRHTTVEAVPAVWSGQIRARFDEMAGFVSSERIDAVLAMVYRLSRTKAQALIEAEAVSVDGRLITGGGSAVKAGARVSVRGYGKFIYDGADGSSRKGKLHARVRVFS